MNWTDTLLQQTVQEKLHSMRLAVVSNREPYMHVYREREIVREQPASDNDGTRVPSINLPYCCPRREWRKATE
jgi:hypothetical protein